MHFIPLAGRAKGGQGADRDDFSVDPAAHPAMIRERIEHAGVVKLVDAPDSKSGVRKDVSVRLRPPAPSSEPETKHEIIFSGVI